VIVLRFLLIGLLIPLPSAGQAEGTRSVSTPMAEIPAGHFVAPYGSDTLEVAAFEIDRRPVTVGEYRGFVARDPRWSTEGVKRIFADENYLSRRASTGDPLLARAQPDELLRPVTEVSWFAARAFCEAHGKRLPTVNEWEFVAQASRERANAHGDSGFNREILRLYTLPRSPELPSVGSIFENYYGVWDLHGLVWEWVEDFNSILLSGASRVDSGLDRQLFCAAGSQGATDVEDYVAFMRYSQRASLTASRTGRNLGFRCARSSLPSGSLARAEAK